MRDPGDSLGFHEFCALGLHLAKGHLRIVLIVKAHRINHDSDLLSPLKQTQRRCLNRPFDASADENEFLGPHLAKQPLDTRLIERVNAPLMQNNLVVLVKQVCRKVGVTVGGEIDMVWPERVADLFLSVGAVDAPVKAVSIAVSVVRMYFTSGDDGYVLASDPCHHSSDSAENPPVVSDAGLALGKEEVFLCVDVD